METTRLKQDIITETVRRWILEGKYVPGEKLPTDTELANQFLVNRCTVAAGLNRLVAENLLDRAPKRGSVVKRQALSLQTNAVALVTTKSGEVYSDLAKYINEHLQENELYPVLLNSQFIRDENQIISFLNQMNKGSHPFGYLLLADRFIPFEELKKPPYCFSNIIFMLRYQNYEELPHAKYVLLDYEDMGRQIVEYFAERNVKRILYPAMYEKHFCGFWSSMQCAIMQGIKKHASAEGIEFDEGFFWRLHSGAPLDIMLPAALDQSDIPTGIFSWTDTYLQGKIFPVVKQCGRSLDEFYWLGNFNTKDAAKCRFDSFDHRIAEIAKIAIDMLTGKLDERKVLLPPKLVRNSEKQI